MKAEARDDAPRTKPDWAVRYLVRRDAGEQAEVRLIIAVLEEAIGCFRKHLLAPDKKRQRLFRDAEAWIMSEENSLPFSFDHVCDIVGLNATYLRRLLRQWRDRQLAVGSQLRPGAAAPNESESGREGGWPASLSV